MEKFVNSHELGIQYPPVLCIANLTNVWKLAVIPIYEINPVLHQFDEGSKNVIFQQVIGTNMINNDKNIKVRFENGNLYIGLYDYSFIVLGKKKSK